MPSLNCVTNVSHFLDSTIENVEKGLDYHVIASPSHLEMKEYLLILADSWNPAVQRVIVSFVHYARAIRNVQQRGLQMDHFRT